MKKFISKFPIAAILLILTSGLIFVTKHEITMRIFNLDQTELKPIGELMSLTGVVLIKKNVVDHFSEAKEKELIPNGARLWTQANASVMVQLDDGTKIELGSNAMIELSRNDQHGASRNGVQMSVFKGEVRPVVVKGELSVLSGGKVSFLAHQEAPLPQATPLPRIIQEAEEKPLALSPVKREMKIQVNAPESLTVQTSQAEGTIRLSVNNSFGQQVFLETRAAEDKNSVHPFLLGKVDPGHYTYQAEWIGDQFESLKEMSGEFEVEDLTPPKVIFQQEVPRLSLLNGMLGWRIFFNTKEKNVSYQLKLICGEQTYLLKLGEMAKDSLFFIWDQPNFSECKGRSQYQVLSKSTRGIEGASDLKPIDSDLIPPEIDLSDGIKFQAMIPYESYWVEISDDPDFNAILYRQKLKAGQPIDFEINAVKSDFVYLRVKGEWNGNTSPFSIAKRYKWVKK